MSQQSRIASLITAVGADIKALQARVISWTDVTNKPSTFTPSAHTHTVADITDFGEKVVKSATEPTDTSVVWVDTSGI